VPSATGCATKAPSSTAAPRREITVEFVLDYWPMLLFVPSLLVLVAILALVTRVLDRD
jgi:hypothetical protein